METYKNIEVGANPGVICDAEGCGYQSEPVPDNELKNWLGRPCPKCGENLLTQEDYDLYMSTIQSVDIINMYSPEDLMKIQETLLQGRDPLEVLKEMAAGAEGVDDITLAENIVSTVSFHKKLKIVKIKNTDETGNP